MMSSDELMEPKLMEPPIIVIDLYLFKLQVSLEKKEKNFATGGRISKSVT